MRISVITKSYKQTII